MNQAAQHKARSGRSRVAQLIALGLVTMCALLSVAIINGAPLYYFDSAGYIDNGIKVINQLGIAPSLGAEASQGGGAAGLGGDGSINASRSVAYSFVLATISVFLSPDFVPYFQAVFVGLTLWFATRIIVRNAAPNANVFALACIAILIASLGALPFYVAYFMPDIFAAIEILFIGLLTIFWRGMSRFEIAISIVVAMACVLFHPSHLLIAALLTPIVALAGIILDRRSWWVPTLFAVIVTLSGVAERVAFSFAAEQVSGSEVVYYPFITARLVEDKVGYAYLEENCPSQELQTCHLYDALQRSKDPFRITASHILFETSENLGSYRLLPDHLQQRVANEQTRFAIKVALYDPIGTAQGVLRNTILQARMHSIDMTVPQIGMLRRFVGFDLVPRSSFRYGRLAQNRDWIEYIHPAHQVLYIASFSLLLVLLVWPSRLDMRMRMMIAFVLVGMAVNAFVCGAVSQPAHRYGARVIWLLPLMATIVGLISTGWFKADDGKTTDE